MNDKIRKIVTRVLVAVTALGILAYIFVPQSNETIVTQTTMETLPDTTTTTTTTTLPEIEVACLVLYVKDSAKFLMEQTPCLDSYVNKYFSQQYEKLELTCRSSGDGSKVNREQLSAKRGETLQFYLMKVGVKYDDIILQSVADDLPYEGVDPKTEEGKVLNRSCEVNGR
jgi:outer membrane protein OmpA-like peptidoglycan-associated protein